MKVGFPAFFILCAVSALMLSFKAELPPQRATAEKPLPPIINRLPPLSCPDGITESCMAQNLLIHLAEEDMVSAGGFILLSRIPDKKLKTEIIKTYNQLRSQGKVKDTREKGWEVFYPDEGIFRVALLDSLGRADEAEKIFLSSISTLSLRRQDEFKFGRLVKKEKFSQALKFGMNISMSPYPRESHGVSVLGDQPQHYPQYKLFRYYLDKGDVRNAERVLQLIPMIPESVADPMVIHEMASKEFLERALPKKEAPALKKNEAYAKNVEGFPLLLSKRAYAESIRFLKEELGAMESLNEIEGRSRNALVLLLTGKHDTREAKELKNYLWETYYQSCIKILERSSSSPELSDASCYSQYFETSYNRTFSSENL